MIHEIGVQLDGALQAKGCPLRVVDGPEFRPTTTFSRERVVIEHDPTGDSFDSRHIANHIEAPTRLTRVTGVKITIYAQNPNKGSIYWEHIRRAEQVLDLVLIALYGIAKARHNIWKPKSGKFVYPDDFKGSETYGGAVYELLGTFDRGVADRTWAGAAAPEATAGTDFNIHSETDATGVQGTETACGG